MTPSTWGGLLKGWEHHLRASGAPKTTIDQRLYHLGRLQREIGCPAHEVTSEQLVEWLAAHRWGPNTRRSYRGSLRGFFGWAHAAGKIRRNPALLVPVVRVPRGRPRPIHETAYRHALATSSGRERLAIRLAGQCGLRRTEVAELAREALEETLAGWSLRVVGKGGHVRMVPVPDDLAAEILRHPAGWLFPSPHGGHLTPAHLGKIVARRLPGAFATHSLRHRAASVGYAGTRDLRAVQELLGHASPETTAIYTAVPDTWIRAAMLAAA